MIAEIFNRVGLTRRFFCEFGAWDGRHLSNTYALLEHGWSGVMIEGDKIRYRDLLKTASAFDGRLQTANAYVSWEYGSPNRLDSILRRANVPADLDILSIDIDSYDYQVWRSLQDFRPRVVVIEINSRLRPGLFSIYDMPSKEDGTSMSSMVELGRSKGYCPVAHTGNVLFVSNELVPHVGLNPNALADPATFFDYHWAQLPTGFWRRQWRSIKKRTVGIPRHISEGRVGRVD